MILRNVNGVKNLRMNVFFVGVGEACDAKHGNTSIHVQTVDDTCILCDCGFSVAHSYFAFFDDSDQLDILWNSHFHGDHFFGIPLLLLKGALRQVRVPFC